LNSDIESPVIDAVYGAQRRGKFTVDQTAVLGPLCGDDLQLGLTVQLAVLERWLTDLPTTLGGWKVGLTSRDLRDSFGSGFRPFGFVLDSQIFASGATVDRSLIGDCSIEPEIYVAIGSDLAGPEVTEDDVRGSIAAVGAAFEINERRLPADLDHPALRIADGLTQWGVVVGQRMAPDIDLSSVSVTLYNGGTPVGSAGPSSEILDDPFLSVARLCRLLAAFGFGLKAGQIVITGSLLPKTTVLPGVSSWRAEFTKLGSVDVGFV
jgi:2-keto-4-pentenoate hydratase